MLEERTLFDQGLGQEIAEREDCRSLKEQNKILQKGGVGLCLIKLRNLTRNCRKRGLCLIKKLTINLQKERILFADGQYKILQKERTFFEKNT